MGEITPIAEAKTKLKANVSPTINGYHFEFANGIEVHVSRIKEKGEIITAEVLITSTMPGTPHHVYHDRLNLLAAQSKKTLRAELKERLDADWWGDVLELISTTTLELYRKGEPVVDITSEDEVSAPRYLLHPLLIRGHPTILYGLGGTGKSFLALACGLISLLPLRDNKLGLSTLKESTKVMYLDYETDRSELTWRLKCLTRGMNLEYTEMQYRRCSSSLHDDVERIRDATRTNDTELVIIDSLAGAAGGDINSPEPAIKFFTALRKLNVASLIIAHTAKNPLAKETTPFGSAFFTNFARSVWELKKDQETGEDSLDIGLYHKKGNMSRLFDALGFKINFTSDSVSIEKSPIKYNSALAAYTSQAKRVTQALLDKGKMTVEEIAFATGMDKDAISPVLSRLKIKSKIDNKQGKWGVLTKEEYLGIVR